MRAALRLSFRGSNGFTYRYLSKSSKKSTRKRVNPASTSSSRPVSKPGQASTPTTISSNPAAAPTDIQRSDGLKPVSAAVSSKKTEDPVNSDSAVPPVRSKPASPNAASSPASPPATSESATTSPATSAVPSKPPSSDGTSVSASLGSTAGSPKEPPRSDASGFGRFLSGTVIALPLLFMGGLYSNEDIRKKAWESFPQLMNVIQYFSPDFTRVRPEGSADKDDYQIRGTDLGNDLEEGVENPSSTLESKVQADVLPIIVGDNNAKTIIDEPASAVSNFSGPRPDEFEHELYKRLKQREETLTKEFESTADKRVAAKLEQERARIEQQRIDELQAQANALNAKLEVALINQEAEIKESFRAEREERLERMKDIEALAEKTQRILQWHSQHQKLGHHVHKLAGTVLMLEQVLNASEPLGEPWENVKTLAAGDDVVAAAIASVPDEVVKRGVPTVKQLQRRFDSVANASRHGALVPPDSGVAGHLLAGTVKALLFEQRSLVKGKDELSKLTRASYFVGRGDLASAIHELSQLDPEGVPAKLCKDWLADANARVATEMAVRLLKSHAADLASNMQL